MKLRTSNGPVGAGVLIERGTLESQELDFYCRDGSNEEL